METEHIIAIFAPAMPIFVGLMKRFFPEEDPRFWALAFSLVIGVSAGLAKLYFGEGFEEVLAKIGLMSSFIFGIGTGLYKLQK